MLMTLTLRHDQAPDLGYLLYKHPDRAQQVPLSFGKAHVFYPKVEPGEATAALLLEIDPVGLARPLGQGAQGGAPALYPYVNDRPYTCSSFLSVAISKVFGSALSGRSKERPELAKEALDFEVELTSLPCRGGAAWVERLFAPLGYEVACEQAELDPAFPEWGPSPYAHVRLRGRQRLTDLLSHLYVLVPALDAQKHYYVGQDEVEKLMRHGQGWLAQHPEHEAIALRYLKRRGRLVRLVVEQLRQELDDGADEPDDEAMDAHKEALERPLSLHQTRLRFVQDVIARSGARRVLDLGCGEGKLVKMLLKSPQIDHVLGVDVSWRTLEIAAKRLHLGRMNQRERARVELTQGSLLYRDVRLRGWDAAALVEVIEHIEPERLGALVDHLFGDAAPGTVVVTTPNQEYNAMFESLPAGAFRHGDHRFEWTRAEFEAWSAGVTERYPYEVAHAPLGPEKDQVGAPSQAAVFTKIVSEKEQE